MKDDKTNPQTGRPAKSIKADTLAAALRANLARRKLAARQTAAAQKVPSVTGNHEDGE